MRVVPKKWEPKRILPVSIESTDRINHYQGEIIQVVDWQIYIV